MALVPILALLALVAGACGVSSGDDDVATDATTATSTTAASGSDEGTDEDESSDTTDPGDETTTTERSTTTEPDDEPDDETTPSTRPGGSDDLDDIDAQIRQSLIDAFVQVGLTTEQATCLADTYLEMGLTDPEAETDPMAMLDAFTECGISMEDLATMGEQAN